MLGDLQNIEAEIVEILVDLEKPSIKPYPGERLKRMALAAQAIKQLCSSRELAGRIDELKQLEPPEQYEDYAKLMGSESCTLCGFNAVEFRRYIKERIAGLRDAVPAHSKALKKKEK